MRTQALTEINIRTPNVRELGTLETFQGSQEIRAGSMGHDQPDDPGPE